MKQWTNAFSSIVISVALIVIIQVISSMIYSMDVSVMGGLVTTGLMMSCFGAWIISRSAPREALTVALGKGSAEQRRALQLFKILGPAALAAAAVLALTGLNLGWVLII